MLRRRSRCTEVEAATGAAADFAQNLVLLLVPPCQATRRGWMHALVLYPLQCVESMLVRPLSQLRRHMPLLGGVCVVALTLWSLLLRSVWRHVHHTLSTASATHDPRLNFDKFWNAVEAYYVFTDATTCNWSLVHTIFGDKIDASTSEDDLWTAIVDSMALLGDPSVRLLHPQAGESSSFALPHTDTVKAPELDAHERTRTSQTSAALLPPLVHVAPHISTFTLPHASSSLSSVMYIRLDAMAGFVDRTFPLDCFTPPSNPAAVPELFDVEAMRWALQSIAPLDSKRTGIILDLRENSGGGSPRAAVAAAAMFLPPHAPAFEIQEPLKAWGHVRRRTFYTPSASTGDRLEYFDGPLVVLQSARTTGTAELVLLALRHRKRTACVGEVSAGRASGVLQMQLPNGWIVEMPHQICRSADGDIVCVQGQGLPPHVRADVTDDMWIWSTAVKLLTQL
ncbi:hypothetical protein H257_03292 [Aphanomyces astaci]|uniref:Tail specific protease domain-containing protein n=2 Tax=Aphanomyces astaci TaxID=112090 RepID=W4H0S7_APHAT|nr:hypothetical protein H257_03292 [Aphanomyces astaci]ETV85585.1 hypothetical protein H257_03292 [Aphanomyces astaci]|eukprot:XP_009825603.1 hypothetical protein H257_03292 [Aphanomyces astaci]